MSMVLLNVGSANPVISRNQMSAFRKVRQYLLIIASSQCLKYSHNRILTTCIFHVWQHIGICFEVDSSYFLMQLWPQTSESGYQWTLFK